MVISADTGTVRAVEEHVIVFERMGHGPSAVGRRADGKVVMAERCAPGDKARVKVITEHRGYDEVEVVELLEASPDRRALACPHAANDGCGGCGWQHLTEDAQAREKELLVRREVLRVAPEATFRPIRRDVPAWGYRRRTRLGYRDGVIGFRVRGEQKIFNLRQCSVLDPAIEVALHDIRKQSRAWGSGNVDVMVNADGDVVVGGPASSFLQPSAVTEAVLIELVLEAVPADAAVVADLFCGRGTFSIPLAKRGHGVRAWDDDKHALAELRTTAPKVSTSRGNLLAKSPDVDLGQPDAVVLDPPRRGAAPLMPIVGKSGAKTVVYVSCEPMTMCRDLGALRRSGYRVDWVQPIDAFPQTEHVETVVRLTLAG